MHVLRSKWSAVNSESVCERHAAKRSIVDTVTKFGDAEVDEVEVVELVSFTVELFVSA